MVKQSDELTAFYQRYFLWLNEGAPIFGHGFRRCYGLCQNAKNMGISYEARKEMKDQFIEAGLDQTYPFNEGSTPLYNDESYHELCHKNKARIKWVSEHANVPV